MGTRRAISISDQHWSTSILDKWRRRAMLIDIDMSVVVTHCISPHRKQLEVIRMLLQCRPSAFFHLPLSPAALYKQCYLTAYTCMSSLHSLTNIHPVIYSRTSTILVLPTFTAFFVGQTVHLSKGFFLALFAFYHYQFTLENEYWTEKRVRYDSFRN